jgi:putative membrane protein
MLKQIFQQRGLFIIITVCIVTLWLFFTDKLVLFIHPRYFIFTAIFAAIGLVFAVIAMFSTYKTSKRDIEKTSSPTSEETRKIVSEHTHEHEEEVAPNRVKIVLSVALTAAVIALLTLFTPTSLSTQNINLARVNNFTFGTSETVDTSTIDKLSVKNWSTVLSGNLPFDDKAEVNLSGFIVPIDDDNFFLTRYVLSCCAIDAQTIAVPVNVPDWKDTLEIGKWVQVEANFIEPTVTGYSHSLKPETLNVIPEPKEPYDY